MGAGTLTCYNLIEDRRLDGKVPVTPSWSLRGFFPAHTFVQAAFFPVRRHPFGESF